MRRFYQESWQGIPFTSFSHISFFHLAEPKFYATFYEELFRRFKDWDDLPAVWRQNKRKDAQWLAARLREQAALRPEGSGPLRVLSSAAASATWSIVSWKRCRKTSWSCTSTNLAP